MILVCGGLQDQVTRFFCDRLKEHGASFRFLDQQIYPAMYRLRCHWQSNCFSGSLGSKEWHLSFEAVSGVYVRHLRPSERCTVRLGETVDDSGLHAENDVALESIFAALPCPVANRIGGVVSNESKPYQALQMRGSSLRIPNTLITNDATEAEEFYELCAGKVVQKSASGMSTGTRRLRRKELGELFAQREVPIQLQEFVPGADLRIHVVGDQIFATRILSKAVDYRFAQQEGLPVRMEPAVLPSEIAKDCIHLTEKFGLVFSGIDLKESPDGQYYSFEVNPSPGFVVYECATGQEVSKALIEFLSVNRR
jgi:glutathione synthase/RimK-type ligase-like ATP-grasp enzyme